MRTKAEPGRPAAGATPGVVTPVAGGPQALPFPVVRQGAPSVGSGGGGSDFGGIPVESLVERVAALGRELVRVAEEAGSAQQAALAATTEHLGLAGRLRMLEDLPAEIEVIYRELDRMAEATANRDTRQGDVLERPAPVDTALEDLRAELERVAGQGQIAELDLGRRLTSLEKGPGDLDAVHRELAELRGRIEEEHLSTTEQFTGLSARMRAVVEGSVRRVESRDGPPGDLQDVYRQIERLTEASWEREEQIAGLRGQLEPLTATLNQVRDELERVRIEVESVNPDRLSRIDDRLGQLESLATESGEALRQLNRAADEVTANHQASPASASVLRDFNDRLRALEALPADMESLYSALHRVAESVKALRADAHT